MLHRERSRSASPPRACGSPVSRIRLRPATLLAVTPPWRRRSARPLRLEELVTRGAPASSGRCVILAGAESTATGSCSLASPGARGSAQGWSSSSAPSASSASPIPFTVVAIRIPRGGWRSSSPQECRRLFVRARGTRTETESRCGATVYPVASACIGWSTPTMRSTHEHAQVSRARRSWPRLRRSSSRLSARWHRARGGPPLGHLGARTSLVRGERRRGVAISMRCDAMRCDGRVCSRR